MCVYERARVQEFMKALGKAGRVDDMRTVYKTLGMRGNNLLKPEYCQILAEYAPSIH